VGIGVLLRGLKRLGREVDHSPQSCAEFKNEWSYTSAPPLCLHGVQRDKSILILDTYYVYDCIWDVNYFGSCGFACGYFARFGSRGSYTAVLISP
jgi:hypothetical protein